MKSTNRRRLVLRASDTMRFAVLGAGTYGTAIAHHLKSLNIHTTIWSRSSGDDLRSVVDGADVLILGVPAQAMREFLSQINSTAPVVNLAKGIEVQRLKRMSEIVVEVLGRNPYAILSGPSFAKDIIAGHPVGLTLASKNRVLRDHLRALLSSDLFDIKVSDDVAGVELGGALKNVFAMGAGLLAGLGCGDSMSGDWFTRSMVEMRDVGQVLGGRWETFSGRSGLGDLAITCTESSRNFRFGQAFATTRSIEGALAKVGSTVEGVSTLAAVHSITQDKSMMTPIIRVLYQTIHSGNIAPEEFLSEVRRLDAKRTREGASTGSVIMRRFLPKIWYRRRT